MFSKQDLPSKIVADEDCDAASRSTIVAVTTRDQDVTAQFDSLDGFVEQSLVKANNVRQRRQNSQLSLELGSMRQKNPDVAMEY